MWPDVSGLTSENPSSTAYMEHRAAIDGRSVPKLRWVSLKSVSPWLVRAVTISEDDNFWNHEGFDFEGMRVAFLRNLEEGRFAAGGSSITQQLAKNLYLTPDKDISRKIKEAVLAIRLESALSKRRILEIYLNVIEWGDGIYGIAAAAKHFYGVAPADLTAEQAARLVAVLPAPRKYSPVSGSRYVSNRANIFLSRMLRRAQR